MRLPAGEPRANPRSGGFGLDVPIPSGALCINRRRGNRPWPARHWWSAGGADRCLRSFDCHRGPLSIVSDTHPQISDSRAPEPGKIMPAGREIDERTQPACQPSASASSTTSVPSGFGNRFGRSNTTSCVSGLPSRCPSTTRTSARSERANRRTGRASGRSCWLRRVASANRGGTHAELLGLLAMLLSSLLMAGEN